MKKVAELLSAFYKENDKSLKHEARVFTGHGSVSEKQEAFYMLYDEHGNDKFEIHPDRLPDAYIRKKMQELLEERYIALSTEREERDFSIQQLENEIKKTEENMKAYRKNAFISGAWVEEIQDVCNEFSRKIKNMQNQISELSESTASEEFIARIPELLEKTFELSSKVHYKKENTTPKDDIIMLLEFITVELVINDKKELSIELFWVLTNLIKYWNVRLEAPIGFEPMTVELCRPLQLTTLPWCQSCEGHYREKGEKSNLLTLEGFHKTDIVLCILIKRKCKV